MIQHDIKQTFGATVDILINNCGMQHVSPVETFDEDIFEKKLTNTAIVIADVARELTGGPPAVIGLSEVENRYVVERLIETPELKKYNYGMRG